MRTITFTSDFGLDDEFVGVCHAVISRIAPDVRVIDLAHGPRSLRGAAAVLAQSVSYTPADAVHLVVVDPGVGTERRPLVLESASGALFVGPDNGVMMEAVEALGGMRRGAELSEPRYRLEPVSATFHGRDVFAPAAAHLAAGASVEDLGGGIDPNGLVRLDPAHVAVSPGRLVADVVRADRFGNLQLAAAPEALEEACPSGRVIVRAGDRVVEAIRGSTFADAEEGGFVVHVDSAGRVAVAVRGGSAEEALGRPDRIVVERDRGSGSG